MDSKSDSPILLDASEVARRLRVSRPYIYRLVELNLLQAVAWAVPGKAKARLVIRFHPDDVAAFIARHRRIAT
jgi:excisionase family DNA binding protein